VRDDTFFEFVDQSEFVGVSTGKQRNTSDEHVWSSEWSYWNYHGEVEAEGQGSGNKGAWGVDNPENSRWRSGEHEGSVDDQTSQETTPSGDAGSSELLALEKNESNSNSTSNRAWKYSPEDPYFSVTVQEGRVKEDHYDGDSDHDSNNEHNAREELSSHEAEGQTNANKNNCE